ncbi:PE-PGRS protein, putative [Trichomonas vaginalis G3]|uniref:receptor protein-tyrosine kinase n=1 Tax=Trichomonas vaginalis (strain ATCC PRA-98 / G3) TaxID=412133 RepID=A2FT34_TRIV3|nr:glycine-rich protein family [Trichomonas vaginalis G3]EAX91943.1 PE-PGRS protein, putative [Trichomonas vaginalis G3]KAI5497540.1 glycine-rich protein family [Trichomonas vaginalis G3]|eukprot:XP_001304873.1 PE-PGRS protein [Trichomonas vaginalis G3]
MSNEVLYFFNRFVKVSNAKSSKVYEILSNPRKVFFEYPCTSPIDCYPYEIHLSPGKYLLEVWGAQGCNVTNGRQEDVEGGTDGHSAGVLIVTNPKTLYLHLGGTANTSNYFNPTYNGGAGGRNFADGCGGGASDFRTSGDPWNESFDSRILIAGGGGGSFGNGLIHHGGKGGGLKGGMDSTGRAAIGTQDGCEATQFERCGTKGIGYGDWYGSGGGGKFGGGNYKIASPSTGSGGGGGSGGIDGVVNYSIWTAVTEFSEHRGFGTGSIALIERSLICSNNIYYSLHSFSAETLYVLISLS